MKPKVLTARDLGNLTFIFFGILDGFSFEGDEIIASPQGFADAQLRLEKIAGFFERYSIANRKACGAWGSHEGMVPSIKADDILAAVPVAPDWPEARMHMYHLMHWAHGPDEYPYASIRMRLSLLTLMSAFARVIRCPDPEAGRHGSMRGQDSVG
ncbi:hypothetical protein [Nitratireductor sp. XY-223]|uniref:hypothetical protein n=1 Tax=Nitratireductor sp. XY-223 TaxID=2561926 RepID=UPI0010AB24B4|nr:hypothetical protein [Nitratireductor sp. XY-223]